MLRLEVHSDFFGYFGRKSKRSMIDEYVPPDELNHGMAVPAAVVQSAKPMSQWSDKRGPDLFVSGENLLTRTSPIYRSWSFSALLFSEIAG
jgi:hypothetical protein